MAYLHLMDSDTYSDTDCKPNGYILLCFNFSHCTESDSNPNCQLQEWDQNRNPYLWMWINHNELVYSLGGQINGEEFVS